MENVEALKYKGMLTRLTPTLYHQRAKMGRLEPTYASKCGRAKRSRGDQEAHLKVQAAAF